MAWPKIFGIGLSKSGTNSLTEALSVLGYNAWHGGTHTWQNGDALEKAIVERADRYAAGETSIDILKGCENLDAMTDFPMPRVYRQLDQQIPDAKFILTYRNPLDASMSMMRMCYPSWKKGDRDKKSRSYQHHVEYTMKHIDAVFEYFWNREDQFIVIDATKGKVNWKILCEFLGVDPSPYANKPWPHKFNHAHWYAQKLHNRLNNS